MLEVTSNLEIPLEDIGDVVTVLNNGKGIPYLLLLKLLWGFFDCVILRGGGDYMAMTIDYQPPPPFHYN